ncbi:MAG: DNA polymerase I [Candidatus Omnitrophica bacterium]|nr:DNA polymerase I [Candidatus Omnitrophota bacterium]
MKKKKVFLVDANSYLYRAYYALPALTTSSGMPTGAVYGFTTFISRILREEQPDYLAFCFDSGKPSFRTEQFKDYKIHRPKMPDELKVQLSKIRELIAAYRLKTFECDRFEADDIIATLAKTLAKKGFSVYIISSDKDMCQLVNGHTKIYKPGKESVILDAKSVKERFGIGPQQIVDFLALAGDKSDNIPGAAGIGDKTAVKLINQFGSLDNLLKNLKRIGDSQGKRIASEKENILLSRQLATLDFNVPIKIKTEDMKVSSPDKDKLFSLFKEMEFKSLLQALDTNRENVEKTRERSNDASLLIKQAREKKELYLYYDEVKDSLNLASIRYFCELQEISQQMRDILSDAGIKKISNDLKRVKIFLADKGIDLKGLFLDFSIAFYLLDSGRSDYSLSSLALNYANKVVADSQHLMLDSAFSLMDDLRPVETELEEKGMQQLFFDIEMPLLEVLADLEMTGVGIDRQILEALSKKVDRQINKLREDIIGLAGREFNINSPKQLSQVLFEELKLPIRKRRKTHAATDEAVLKSLSNEHPIVEEILKIRQLTKLKTTYLDVFPKLIDKKARLHTSLNQTGTQTGRLSSSNPNLQNIPIKTEVGAQIRKAFIPSKVSNFLLSADYSQIELRILAHLSGEENLIEAFKNNEDVHNHTASLIFGVDKKDLDESMRNIAKRVNFGIIYGISSFGLAKDLGVALYEAEEFIENYFLRYPKVKDFMISCIEDARRDGFISTIMGRRRYLPAINSQNIRVRSFAERQAINMPVQGSAADLIKKAMLDIFGEFKEKGFSSKMVLQVHDELIFDCEKKELEDIIAIIKSKMEHAFSLSVPIKVTIKKGKNWLEMEEC